MKKKNVAHSITCVLLALTVFCTTIFSTAAPAKAAKKESIFTMQWEADQEKVHIRHGEFGGSFVKVILPAAGYRVSSIHSSGKNCKVRAAVYGATHKMETDGNYVSMSETFDSAYCELEIYASKRGAYQISFDITDTLGQCVKTKKLTVYANREEPFTQVTINGEKLESYSDYFCTDAKEPILRVKMASGYKLLKIQQKYGYPYKYSKIKNGKKFRPKVVNETVYVIISYMDKYTKRTESVELYLKIWSEN